MGAVNLSRGIAVVVVAAMAVGSCGTRVTPVIPLRSPIQPAPAVATFGGTPSFPPVAGVVSEPRKLSSSEYQILGGSPVQQTGDRNVIEGGALHLSSDSQGKTVCAVYCVPGLTGDRPVRLSVDAERIGTDGAYWLGIADYTTYSWQWFGPFGAASTRLLNSATLRDRYVDRNGALFFAVLLGGGEVLVRSGTATTSPDYLPNNPHYPMITECRLGSDKTASGLNPGDQYVTLAWDHVAAFGPEDAQNEATRYEILRRGPDDASPVLIGTIAAPLKAYVDPVDNTKGVAPAKPGRTYQYFLRAVNATNGATPLATKPALTIPNYWVTTWGGVDFEAGGTFAVADQEGNVYTVGSVRMSGSTDYDVLLLKYDPDGTLLWQREWGTKDDDSCLWAHPQVAADGSVWLTAYTDAVSFYGKSATMLGFSPDGELISQRTTGWWGVAALYSIQASAGTVYCAGDAQAVDGARRPSFVLAISPNGNFLWQRAVATSLRAWIEAVLPLDDGVILAINLGYTSDQGSTALVRLDSSGWPVWQRLIRLPAHPDWGRYSTACLAGDGIVGTVSLYLSTDTSVAYAFKSDLDGNLVWQRQWSSAERVGFSQPVRMDSGLLVFIGGRVPVGEGNGYPLILQCDPGGSLIQAETWSRTGTPRDPPVLLGDALLFPQLAGLARWVPGEGIVHLAEGAGGQVSALGLSLGRIFVAGSASTFTGASWKVSEDPSEPVIGDWIDGDLTWEPVTGLIVNDNQPLTEASGTVSDPGGLVDPGETTGYGTQVLTMAWDPALIWGN